MKIYLAGKISANDWRHQIVTELRNVDTVKDYKGHVILPDGWPTLKDAIFGQHDYVGPYFITSNQHGPTYHGRDKHGNGANGGDFESPVWSPSNFEESPPDHGGDLPDNQETRLQVVRLCLRAIQHADVVFAWIDSMTAYGTLVELGFAVARQKPIWWVQKTGDYDIKDMWFARTCAKEVRVADEPAGPLRELLEKYEPRPVNGYVYLLQSGEHFKIGKSKDVDQRVTQISPKTPLPVTLLHTIASNDMSWAEWLLHRKFSDYRTNGEWFALPPEAVAWIQSQTYLRRS